MHKITLAVLALSLASLPALALAMSRTENGHLSPAPARTLSLGRIASTTVRKMSVKNAAQTHAIAEVTRRMNALQKLADRIDEAGRFSSSRPMMDTLVRKNLDELRG